MHQTIRQCVPNQSVAYIWWTIERVQLNRFRSISSSSRPDENYNAEADDREFRWTMPCAEIKRFARSAVCGGLETQENEMKENGNVSREGTINIPTSCQHIIIHPTFMQSGCFWPAETSRKEVGAPADQDDDRVSPEESLQFVNGRYKAKRQ
jgi:hypothetical protein